MVFAHLVFLYLFLPINLILYYASSNKLYRNLLLTAFSFFFYAWGEPVWILLLLGSSTVDWLIGLYIDKHKGTSKAKAGIVFSVIVNISLLVVFKYSGFLYENINALFGTSLSIPTFTLPIGISFFTFQSLSYTIDLYRNEVPVQKSLSKFYMYVSLYPQLVAGPIVRYQHVVHEIDERKFNIKDMSSGIHRFCIGLFKKVCIANVAAEFVGKYMDGDLSQLTTGEAWFGLLMFSVQIYFDFSGYSDMAIGLGRLFGFHFHENFNYPYIAKSATEFWRRWHISLGSFFRDYVYIPLGGNKKFGIRNLFIVWFLTGLWHGASWNFILWGLYFGVLIWIERLFLMKVLTAAGRMFSHLYLLIVAVIGWGLFYFDNMSRLQQFFSMLFGQSAQGHWNVKLEVVLQENMFWLILAIVLCMPVYKYANRMFKKFLTKRNVNWMWFLSTGFNYALLLLATAMLAGKSYNPFIYFRF